MVKSLDEQIESLQERQAQLKAREDDLRARRRERERKARTKRLIEVGAMAESAAGFEGSDERPRSTSPASCSSAPWWSPCAPPT